MKLIRLIPALALALIGATSQAAVVSDDTGSTCAIEGAHSGVWVLQGDKQGVELGIVPSGDASALLVQHPRYRFLTPLNVIVNTIR